MIVSWCLVISDLIMDKQKTIEKTVSISGIGLHTANKVNITFRPADIDTGINFIRTDIAANPVIKASIENVVLEPHSLRRTSITKGNIYVHTIEHLMAGLSGLGIDNISIEIDNDEVPGLDGSASDFIRLLTSAGIREQEKERRYFSLKEPVFVEDEGVSIIALPFDGLKISYTLRYNHPMLNVQFEEIDFNAEVFVHQIGSARTFCLEAEADELQKMGFGKGANYDNTLVVGREGVLKNRLRYEDEFVRHKILDLSGDLYLVGCPLKAHIVALKSGHSLNLKLVKKIYRQKQESLLAGIAIDYRPKENEQLDAAAIMQILPHRDPFLFIDRVISLERGRRITAIKNVTINDYFFKGHFPGRPVMPGVLIIEAMAQAGGIMMLSQEENRGKLAFFMAINNVKFRKTVVPGDQLVLEVTAGKIKSKTGQVYGKAYVDGKLAAEAELMFALAERE